MPPLAAAAGEILYPPGKFVSEYWASSSAGAPAAMNTRLRRKMRRIRAGRRKEKEQFVFMI
jgi:hypothetical protein